MDQFRRLGESAIALVCAPAGYGKTLSMIQYGNLFEGTFLWIGLDARDNAPTRLIANLAAALVRAGILRDEPDLLDAVARKKGVEAEALLSRLLNLLERYKRPILLALDDCHLIRYPGATRVIAQILQQAPAQMKFLLATRTRPTFATAKLRATGRIIDINEDDLAFRADEIASLFKKSGVNITSEALYDLNKLWEGWPAGIQLFSAAYLETRRRTSSEPDLAAVHELVERHLDEYFNEEVLLHLPVPVRHFMLKTSVVESFSLPLAALLSRLPQERLPLKRLLRENTFLQVISKAKGWYRFHPLLQQFLYRQYSRSAPKEVQQLHREAADWFMDNKQYAEALHQYGRSRDVRALLDMLEKHTFDLIREGDVSDLMKALDCMPGDLGDDYLAVTVVEAAVVHVIHDTSRIRACMNRLAHLIESTPPDASRERLKQTTVYLAAHLAYLTGHFSDGIQLGDGVLNNESPSNAAIAVLRHHRADCYLALGMLPQARRDAEQALRELTQFGLVGYINTPAFILGQIELAEGCLQLAEQRFSELKPEEIFHSTHYNFYDIFYFLGIGAVRTRQNRLEEAREFLETALSIAQKYPPSAALPWVLHQIALMHCASNEIESATKVWDEARTIAENSGLIGVHRLCSSYRVRLALRKSSDDPVVQGWESDWDGILERVGASTLPEERLTYAWLQLRKGNWRESFRTCKRLIADCTTQGNRALLIDAYLLLGALYQERGRVDLALKPIDSAIRLSVEYEFPVLFHHEGRDLLDLFRAGLASTPADDGGFMQLPYRDQVEYMLIGSSGHAAAGAKAANVSSDDLTRRELDVLKLMAEGQSNQEIAGTLFVGISTVKTHVNNIFKKLGAKSRDQAIDRAIDLGIIA